MKKTFILPLLVIGLFVLNFAQLQAQRRYRVGYKQQGLTSITEGILFAPSNFYKSGLGLQTVIGYQVNPHFSAGIGTGVQSFDSDVYIPAFADLRAYFIADKPFTPYVYGEGGYAIRLEGHPGGLTYTFGVGGKFYTTHTFALNFSLGYWTQYIPFDPDNSSLGNRNISALAVKLGFSF